MHAENWLQSRAYPRCMRHKYDVSGCFPSPGHVCTQGCVIPHVVFACSHTLFLCAKVPGLALQGDCRRLRPAKERQRQCSWPITSHFLPNLPSRRTSHALHEFRRGAPLAPNSYVRQTSFTQCTAGSAEKVCSRRSRGNTWQPARSGSLLPEDPIRPNLDVDSHENSARPSLRL